MERARLHNAFGRRLLAAGPADKVFPRPVASFHRRPDDQRRRCVDMHRKAHRPAMVPASRTCTRSGPGENKGQRQNGNPPASQARRARRSNSASVHTISPLQLSSFLGASSSCTARRPDRHLCSETDRQAAVSGTPVSHMLAGACGRPSIAAPTINVADASTCTARLIARRWSPPLGPAPDPGQARIRDKSASAR